MRDALQAAWAAIRTVTATAIRTARASRGLWLVSIALFFCLPLLIGLGRTDLQSDEAIYSFGVDVMLADGDWLTPKSSPSADLPFLEKPPLKFWIVALPIRLGLLPDNEFGLRFWDAVSGGLAFLYLFAIGRSIGGPACGVAAVLMLFVHRSLLFEHGLRSNNMEAPLLLAYCGGIYHFLRWRAPDGPSRERRHVAAATLYFVLGFMTKFLAALFLPAVMAAALVWRRSDRTWILGRWRAIVTGAVLAAALIAPWFIYQHVTFGATFWEDILGAAVVTRLTAHLNPEHVQPWHFYLTTLWIELSAARIEWWTVGGVGLLIWQTLRKRWFEGVTILLWFALPMAVISAGTSKLYHYAYPFLPPLALAGGLMAAAAITAVASALAWLATQLEGRLPRAARTMLDGRAVRAALMIILVAGGLLVAVIVVTGPFKIAAGGQVLMRASTPYRVLAAVVLALILWRRRGPLTVAVAVLVVATLLPTAAYRSQLAQFAVERHTLRSLRDCIQRVGAADFAARAGRPPVYAERDKTSHPVAFYLRTLGNWTRVEPSDTEIETALHVEPRPVLLSLPRFRALDAAWAGRGGLADVPAVPVPDGIVLLPGPFEVCAIDHRRAERR